MEIVRTAVDMTPEQKFEAIVALDPDADLIDEEQGYWLKTDIYFVDGTNEGRTSRQLHITRQTREDAIDSWWTHAVDGLLPGQCVRLERADYLYSVSSGQWEVLDPAYAGENILAESMKAIDDNIKAHRKQIDRDAVKDMESLQQRLSEEGKEQTVKDQEAAQAADAQSSAQINGAGLLLGGIIGAALGVKYANDKKQTGGF